MKHEYVATLALGQLGSMVAHDLLAGTGLSSSSGVCHSAFEPSTLHLEAVGLDLRSLLEVSGALAGQFLQLGAAAAALGPPSEDVEQPDVAQLRGGYLSQSIEGFGLVVMAFRIASVSRTMRSAHVRLPRGAPVRPRRRSTAAPIGRGAPGTEAACLERSATAGPPLRRFCGARR